jgi:flagellar protein FliO/FliZ
MEPGTYLRFLLALVFVLALIGLAAWLARRFGLAGAVPMPRGRRRRLGIVESVALDGKRRLVLVRRDTTEHLLLLGAGPDLVVETGIVPPPEALAEPATDASAATPDKPAAAASARGQARARLPFAGRLRETGR